MAGTSGFTLLPEKAITSNADVGQTVKLPSRAGYLLVEVVFAYGSGGTALRAYLQTRVTGGTWRDVASFLFANTAAVKWSAVHRYTALAAAVAASDAALSDNTILNGFLGDEVRIKYATTGTYANTTLTVRASVKG